MESKLTKDEMKYLKMPYCNCSACEEMKKKLKKKISKKSVISIDRYKTRKRA